MPYKHGKDCRHKFERPLYKVTNSIEYNAALKRRGDFTMWFTADATAEWCPAKTGARGRPSKYYNVAIETALFIRQVFHLVLRQTEGFVNALARALKVQAKRLRFSEPCRRCRKSSLAAFASKEKMKRQIFPGMALHHALEQQLP